MKLFVSVDDNVRTISRKSGEAQSTVIPPGKNPDCPGGRFLVTQDGRRPPDSVVVGRDLQSTGDLDVDLIESTFEPMPNAHLYRFGTNDHDLICLSNGDVLYITGAFSKAPIKRMVPKPNPAWWDLTFREMTGETFGPGARTVVLVWRSTDGGRNFKYLPAMEMDPARIGDGSAAFPQFRNKVITNDTSDTSDDTLERILESPYDMGGTDGQLISVDRKNDRLYLTFGCVGYQPDTSAEDFALTETRLNKTLVMTAKPGEPWTPVGFVPMFGWRFGTVPLEDGTIGFGLQNKVTFARPKTESGQVKYVFDQDHSEKEETVDVVDWSWKAFFKENENGAEADPFLHSWVHNHTICTRVGSGKSILLAYPFTPMGKVDRGSGYRIVTFNRADKTFSQAGPDVVPKKSTTDSWVMHLTAIDIGRGPVLLYWYDIDAAAKKATVRGRLINENGGSSSDFDISQAAGAQRSFLLDQDKGDYWYGDYLTAGGFRVIPKITSANSQHYRFMPMWVEPDNTIRYTSVNVTVQDTLGPTPSPPGLEIKVAKPGLPVKAKPCPEVKLPLFVEQALQLHNKNRGPGVRRLIPGPLGPSPKRP